MSSKQNYERECQKKDLNFNLYKGGDLVKC